MKEIQSLQIVCNIMLKKLQYFTFVTNLLFNDLLLKRYVWLCCIVLRSRTLNVQASISLSRDLYLKNHNGQKLEHLNILLHTKYLCTTNITRPGYKKIYNITNKSKMVHIVIFYGLCFLLKSSYCKRFIITEDIFKSCSNVIRLFVQKFV